MIVAAPFDSIPESSHNRSTELTFKLRLRPQNLFLCWRKHAVEPTQNGHRQNYVLVLAALEGVAEEVCHTPKETDDLAMVY